MSDREMPTPRGGAILSAFTEEEEWELEVCGMRKDVDVIIKELEGTGLFFFSSLFSKPKLAHYDQDTECVPLFYFM